MNKKEFNKLPIGTVLIKDWGGTKYIEVKISEYETISVEETNHNVRIVGLTGIFNNYNLSKVAPDWMQELWRID